MKRRDYIKTISLSSFGLATLPTTAMVPDPKDEKPFKPGPGRTKDEIIRDKKITQMVFFTPEEMKTLRILSDIIIPKDEVSGSASEAKVPEFIEFMVNDIPSYQTPFRGGINWLNNYSNRSFGKNFNTITAKQRIEIIDKIAYPNDFEPALSHGVKFFSLMRNFTATGFYTTQMGFKDLDYKGNQPNFWDGVPQSVLDKYKLEYDALYFKNEE